MMKKTFWMTEIHQPTEVTTKTNFALNCCDGLPVVTLDEIRNPEDLGSVAGRLESAVVYLFAADEDVVTEFNAAPENFL